MLKDQPFRVDGNRAYGLGIADDKQGVALILHTVAMLQKLNSRITARSPCSSMATRRSARPAARSNITKFAADQDAVFSFEGGGTDGTLRLATSGIGSAYLTVHGKSSHAGAAPERGINALYELSHQILQMQDLSEARAGPEAELDRLAGRHQPQRDPGRRLGAGRCAGAQGRRLRRSCRSALQEKIKKQLLPDTKVELKFEVRRPPLEANDASRRVAAYAQDDLRGNRTVD